MHAGGDKKFPGVEDVVVRFMLLLAGVVFSIILAEVLLLFIPRFRPEPSLFAGEFGNRQSMKFVPDPATGWRLRRESGFSNAQGFRGKSDFNPSDKRKKIILVGDSFTYGSGVPYEDTFGAVIESQLEGRAVVWNLAMPGFGIDQMWQSVRHQALPLKPDLVIVGFIISDFARSLTAYRVHEGFNKPTFKLVDGRLIPRTAEDRPNFLVQVLQRHSCLWTLGVLAYRAVALRFPVGEWWTLNRAILEAIRADCRANGVPVLFLYVPTREWHSFPTLRSYMQRVGANFIDLTDASPLAPQDIFLDGYGHLNAKGHRYVADVVLRWTRQNTPGLLSLEYPANRALDRTVGPPPIVFYPSVSQRFAPPCYPLPHLPRPPRHLG